MWTEDRQRCDCASLEETLAQLQGAERMVVGHTIQVTPGHTFDAHSSRPLEIFMAF